MKTILFLLAIVLTGGFSSAALAQLRVSGIVTDASSHKVIPGCSVLLKHGNRGVATDLNGAYEITACLGDTLVFSFIGYNKAECIVRSERCNVALQQDTLTLEEADVTGYYIGRKFAVNRAEASSEEYKNHQPNTLQSVIKHPLSTFSIDVDAASYSNVRRFINNGSLPPADAVRSEELINYFSYDYPVPSANQPIRVTTEVSGCPWHPEHRLIHIGLKAKDIDPRKLPASNFVFLIDVSGSMSSYNKLPLLKSSLKLLLTQFRENDRVAIVTYAGETTVNLPSTNVKNKKEILEAIESLTANGSTAGGAGIQEAYRIARQNYLPQGNNRVILATDGDFNVGIRSEKELENLIEQERQSGVFLTVLGFGMGNYKDNRLQLLAEKGNGNHAYIDNLSEARKVLVNEFSSNLYTIAKDVKLQIEFNPAKVEYYRLIGYESRLLADEDFNDDHKDAGEIGVGHTVTALYEIIPAGVGNPYIDPLKYQKNGNDRQFTDSPELMTIKIRYKEPGKFRSQKLEIPVNDSQLALNKTSDNFRFSAAVAAFGMLLTHSSYSNGYTYNQIAALAREALGKDPEGYRREFVRLVEAADLLSQNQ